MALKELKHEDIVHIGKKRGYETTMVGDRE